MGGVAQGQALGDGVLDAEGGEDEIANDIAQNSRDNDDGGGDGHHAPQLPGQLHADGGGHRLGQQGHIQLVVQPEEHRQGQNAQPSGDDARPQAAENGQPVGFQQLQLPIQGHRQGHRGGREQVGQILGPLIVVVVGDAQGFVEQDDTADGNEQGIEDGQGELPPQQQPHLIGDEAHTHPEKQGITQKLSHASPSIS